MENTDKIKDMITLIEKNNESYHDALSNLADTCDNSFSDVLSTVVTLNRPDKDPVNTGGNQGAGVKNPITTLGRLILRKD